MRLAPSDRSGDQSGANRKLRWACAAEVGLVILAGLLAWIFSVPLLELVNPAGRQVQAFLIGLVATAPMVAFLGWMLTSGWGPIAGLRDQVQRLVGRMLDGATTGPILATAVMAGVGEELLFRGALQPLLVRWLTPVAGDFGPWLAVLAASVLFGLAHPMSWMYIAVATVGGLYLGALAQASGEVLSAVVAHAAYDVIALYWIRASASAADESPADS